MSGQIQRAVAAVFLSMSVALAVPSLSLAAVEPTVVRQQDQRTPSSSLTPAQQQAFLDSVEQQIQQGVLQFDPSQRPLLEAGMGSIRACLNAELAAGRTISDAANRCGDMVQEAISPGDGVEPIAPEDQQWLAQADTGLRNRGRNQGWNAQDAETASLLTTGCIARFLKAGAPKEVGLQKCSFAFTIWQDARSVAGIMDQP
jgi:hypothetical protein